MAEAIPVTLLTGFLGAGKTTLLNHLVRQPAFAGAAVLINEFGEIGLDHLLVEQLDADTMLLNAGCLCCTVRGDLVAALSRLQPRGPRHVLIETTGLADPAPILGTLLADPFVALHYRLDGVVTVVDAVNADTQLARQPEAARQVAAADLLLVTKTDLAATTALRAQLASLNPAAPVLDVAHGRVDPAAILGIGGHAPPAGNPEFAAWLGTSALAPHAHHHDPNRHDSRIRAFCITREAPLPWHAVGTWLEMLIATRGDDLLRVKAILNLAGQDRPVVLHGVQHLFHPPTLLDAWPAGDPRTSRLVFIVRDLDRAAIESGLFAFERATLAP